MKVTNWETWQTFRKDRGTPQWIKLYRNLLSNAEWMGLSDAEKGHLVSIWILAADKKGAIPSDAKVIQKMVGLDETPNLSKFIDLQFLATTCPSDGCQVVKQEDSRVEESRVKIIRQKPKGLLTTSVDVINDWNKFASTNNLSQKRAPTDNLKRQINTISKNQKWANGEWNEFFTILSDSDFLMGKVKKWKMTLDWLVKPENFSKAISGNYINE